MSPTSLLTLNLVLATMMFGIALSLRVADFRRVLTQPRGPVTGLLAQFLLLPAATWLMTLALPVGPQVALGMLLVGSCPGGSFSNIMTHLARGNTALSVSMTGGSSLAAAVMTPLNFFFYSSLNPETAALLKAIDVPAGQVLTVVGLVLALPLTLGLIAARLAPALARRVEAPFRLFSLIMLIGFVLVALTQNWSTFAAGAGAFLLVVVAHNALALGIGRLSALFAGLDTADRRAVTLEVGIQNSGHGLGLIFTFFHSLSGMALVAAAWGIWHLISGLGLVGYWHRLDMRETEGVWQSES